MQMAESAGQLVNLGGLFVHWNRRTVKANFMNQLYAMHVTSQRCVQQGIFMSNYDGAVGLETQAIYSEVKGAPLSPLAHTQSHAAHDGAFVI